ncbi:MAG: hypothetical protein QM811_10070 [Pirellulales bacterium]
MTAVPDEKRGERLIVLYVPSIKSVESLRRGLVDAGLPNLYIPAASDFHEIPTMPVLGTGKLDLGRIKELALESTASDSST